MQNHPDFGSYDLPSSLRTGVMAGSLCPVEVMKRCIDDMHMAEVSIAYGMTETSPVSSQTRDDDDLDRRTATIGRVHPHVEIKIVDPETGETVERGETGEFCTRGYSVMLGYWDDPEKTAEAIDADGWMHTGDLAVMREDGYCNIVGRIKDMVIRGGENIYPREIEEFLYTHPDIEDVQVIGVPDEKYGEELCAWVKMSAGRRAAGRRRGARVRHRQARALQDPALRDGRRGVPDDRHRQDPQGPDAREPGPTRPGGRGKEGDGRRGGEVVTCEKTNGWCGVGASGTGGGSGLKKGRGGGGDERGTTTSSRGRGGRGRGRCAGWGRGPRGCARRGASGGAGGVGGRVGYGGAPLELMMCPAAAHQRSRIGRAARRRTRPPGRWVFERGCRGTLLVGGRSATSGSRRRADSGSFRSSPARRPARLARAAALSPPRIGRHCRRGMRPRQRRPARCTLWRVPLWPPAPVPSCYRRRRLDHPDRIAAAMRTSSTRRSDGAARRAQGRWRRVAEGAVTAHDHGDPHPVPLAPSHHPAVVEGLRWRACDPHGERRRLPGARRSRPG